MNYYNEFDPKAAARLRQLIECGVIPYGIVDERSIEDVAPSDLSGFTSCHFFAGIGVWPFALRNAGWPDDLPVWTGSCPCQPFSSAGKGKGFADERHLWPAFEWLIAQSRPNIIFGEQVASKDGLAWFDLVQADLEGQGYAVGVADTCAAGFGAPHIRQRLYWLADSGGARPQGRASPKRDYVGTDGQASSLLTVSGVANAAMRGCKPKQDFRSASLQQATLQPREVRQQLGDMGAASCGLDHSYMAGRNRWPRGGEQSLCNFDSISIPLGTTGPTNGKWRNADWLFCRDEQWRPVEPGSFPLANGLTGRMGLLRGYGNGLVEPQARGFIEAYKEAVGME